MLSIVQSRLSLNVMEIICWCHEYRSSSAGWNLKILFNQTQKYSLFGHITRQEGIQRKLLKGLVDGERGGGRPRPTRAHEISRYGQNDTTQTGGTIPDSRPFVWR